jgi:hypothetical protein
LGAGPSIQELKPRDSEMAPQAIEIAQNGLGKWRSAALLSFSERRHGNRIVGFSTIH